MAVDLIEQTLERAPHWTEARFTLAETLAEVGRRDDAVAAYRAYLERDPTDSMGAAARLHLLGVGEVPDLSPAYVRRLFDQYAPRFEGALLDALRYRVPQLICDSLVRHAHGRRFTRALDLGCGTGLTGAAVRDIVDQLYGVDLSPGMLAAAASKAIYDQLTECDIMAALNQDAHYDLILAGDVLVYIRDLSPVLAAVRSTLASGGVFAFSLEHADGTDVVLGHGQRYRHGVDLMARLISAHGFTAADHCRTPIRREGHDEVIGNIYLLTR